MVLVQNEPIDTDLQWAYWEGVLKIFTKLTNPTYKLKSVTLTGADSPNKKYYDPRVWLRKGEDTFVKDLLKRLLI